MSSFPKWRWFVPALAVAAAPAATLEIGDTATNRSPAVIAVGLGGGDEVAGLQFDLTYPAGAAGSVAPVLLESAPRHLASAREISPGVLRVVVYSPTNAALPESLFLNLNLGFANTVAGGPVVRAGNIRFTNAAGREIQSSARYGPLAEWRDRYFSEEEWNDPVRGGDQGDWDGDGAPNLVEYLADTDPKLADGTRPLSSGPVVSADDGKTYFVFRWWQAKEEKAVNAQVRGSTDLSNEVSVASIPTGYEDDEAREMEAKVEMGAHPKYFFRLHLQRR